MSALTPRAEQNTLKNGPTPRTPYLALSYSNGDLGPVVLLLLELDNAGMHNARPLQHLHDL